METPFLYQTEPNLSRRLSLEYHVVRDWLSPKADIEKFGDLVRGVFTGRRVRRVTIPDLIIELVRARGFAKRNLVQMLVALYYASNEYFYERGSEFLISRAFEDVRSEDYYV